MHITRVYRSGELREEVLRITRTVPIRDDDGQVRSILCYTEDKETGAEPYVIIPAYEARKIAAAMAELVAV